MDNTASKTNRPREPWNKGKLVGQKAPFKLKEVWAIRVWLQLEHRTRELALFDLGLDSKLRSCDLVKLKVRDICHGDRVAARATVMQQKTSRPVQFEITEQTRSAVTDWMKMRNLHSEDYLFPSRVHNAPHLGTRQYARIVDGWVNHIGLDPLRLRHPFHAAHQGHPHLQAHEELARSAAFARSCQAGIDCTLPGY